MQPTEHIFYQNKRRRYNAEEYRIGQYGKNSLCKLSFGGDKKYRILTDKRKDKSEEELKRPIWKEKFRVEQKRGLKHYPRAPNDISVFLAVF